MASGIEGLGHRIREARIGAGMKQKDLAARVGVEPIQISRWERGENKPDLDRLELLAGVLRRPLSYFFGEPEAPLTETELHEVVQSMMQEFQDLLDRRLPPDDRS